MSDRFARLLLLAVLLTACGSPADKKLTKENLEALNKSKALTGEELQLLQGYVLRTGMANAFSGKGAEGILDSSVTIREAINKQRQWATDDSIRTATEAAAAAEAVRKHEAEVARLRAIIVVTPVRKSFGEESYQSFVRFQMVAKNAGTKPVRAFKGYVRVTDLFGDLISRLEIKQDDPLAAGAERVFSTAYSYNQFMDRDTKLRFTDFDKMKFIWEPEVILFADGTELIVPEMRDR